MKTVFLLFLAASTLHFDITDARGKKPSGISLEVSEPDDEGWMRLKVVNKGKGTPVLIWPYDGKVKPQDGPGEIPALVMESGDLKALANPRVIAALEAGKLLGAHHDSGLDPAAFAKAVAGLTSADDAFAKGVGLLAAKKPAEAMDLLSRALKERERQLTRVPSEVYPAAMLAGRAFLEGGKFDEAAVALLKALKLHPADEIAQKLREEALVKAGKPEAR